LIENRRKKKRDKYLFIIRLDKLILDYYIEKKWVVFVFLLGYSIKNLVE